MFLVVAAFAAEPGDAFVCPVMTEPADGLRYADPGEISEALYDTLSEWVFAQYEEGCPVACAHEAGCSYADDCYTSAGTHIVVEYANVATGAYTGPHEDESWDVTVDTADGTTLALSHVRDYDEVWEPGYTWDDHSWVATWAGALDPALPEVGSVTVATEWHLSSWEATGGNPWWTGTEALDSGGCSWNLTQGGSSTDGVSELWMGRYIRVGAQELIVDGGWVDLCEAVRARGAWLDGVEYAVDYDTWETLPDGDADRDGVPASTDCDDTDPRVSPCEQDRTCDGLDQDCDGTDAGGDCPGEGPTGPVEEEEPSGCGHAGAWMFLPLLWRGGRSRRTIGERVRRE